LQAKRDREAAAAEDGWTVVVNKGGRKKNTDESGISVGAVDVTAATERAKKKQRKEGILDFYRFQRREARRNEVLELQQKFEEDKKRIAKMKAARKFRPF
jgi:ribosomal RNA-processing protein 7